jgi:selenocysteine-specific elongation factor
LREPLLLLPGDRFIVRMFSPVVTIGGGIVLDIAAPPRIKRAALDQRLTQLETGDRVSLLVAESKFGMSIADLIARTGLPRIEESTDLIRLPEGWIASKATIENKIAHFRNIVREFHKNNPLKPGLSKEELRSRELPGAPAFLLDAMLARAKDIVAEGEIVRLASHRVALKEDEEAATAKIESLFRDAGLAVPSMQEVLSKSGIDSSRARPLLQILLKQRKLIRVGDDLIFHASAMDALRQTLAARKGVRFSVPDFKDWTGVSRKYAIPLLEFLDRERLTRRDGDLRLII